MLKYVHMTRWHPSAANPDIQEAFRSHITPRQSQRGRGFSHRCTPQALAHGHLFSSVLFCSILKRSATGWLEHRNWKVGGCYCCRRYVLAMVMGGRLENCQQQIWAIKKPCIWNRWHQDCFLGPRSPTALLFSELWLDPATWHTMAPVGKEISQVSVPCA